MMMIGNFTKINYSVKQFTMIGLYLAFPILLADAFLEKMQSADDLKWSNKNHLYYYPKDNESLLQDISQIERDILQYYKQVCHIENLEPEYNFYCNLPLDELQCMKYYREYSSLQVIRQKESIQKKYYIKISGIWENEKKYGVTYKIVEYMTPIVKLK